MSSPVIQVTHQYPDDNKKRLRPKNVTWPTQDKLIQVRLFAAEDPPLLSGLLLQDLLEAKKSKFMHVLAPVSADDLPPGFGGVATKRARLDTAAIAAMVAQINWQSPERFWYDQSWQVGVGDESLEVKVQGQREVRVLEAVYPRPSAIPVSSMELHEVPSDIEDVRVLQIPVIPLEDEEDGVEENDTPGIETNKSVSSSPEHSVGGDDASLAYPPGYSPRKDEGNLTLKSHTEDGSSSAAGQFNSDLTTRFLQNADPDVAAAAAAAYAVLKAKESGTVIDHDLLVKILSNPLLIETLTASNPSLRKQLGDSPSNVLPNREDANGNGLKMSAERFGDASLLGAAGIQGRQRYDSSEGMIVSGIQGNLGRGLSVNVLPASQGRGYTVAGAHEQLSTMKGMLGQVKAPFATTGPAGRSYTMRHQDIPRELIQQHAMAGMVTNESQSTEITALMAFDEAKLTHNSERYEFSGVSGLKGQPWLGNNPSAASSKGQPPWYETPQDRLLVGAKIRKQCFFFNTSRGCRNGIHCNFLHETAPEKPFTEKTDHDAGRETKTFREDEAGIEGN